ncbi:MAG: oligosaccharide flippase family protein [Pseudomonadota bacterium]
METRKLLSNTLLYGIADVVVMAVGGFLLLPLYTRTLSQAEFGTYVIVRANTEIFSYLLYFGLPSAVARVYFDYKKIGQHEAYLSSVLLFFGLNLVVCGTLLAIWGADFWALLSPATAADPYLAYSVAIAAVGFMASLGSLWLRLDGRVTAFALMQVATSIVLALCAMLNLVVFDLGLPGLLLALLASSACASLVLPWLLRRGFRWHLNWAHIQDSLRYAGPILVGYLAYFLLNRMSTLVLQRHVAAEQIAIFGLAQQLAMMLTIAGTAFGKAQQPAVFAAEPSQAADVLARSGALLRWLMFGTTAMLILGASELFALMAPKSYAAGFEILLILLVANFAYSFLLVSDTALLYHRMPKTSVLVSIVGAALSAVLSLWLVPRYHLFGAAAAIVATFVVMALFSHWLAWRVTGQSYLGPMLLGLLGASALAAFAAWLPGQGLSVLAAGAVKLGIAAALLVAIYLVKVRKPVRPPCAP